MTARRIRKNLLNFKILPPLAIYCILIVKGGSKMFGCKTREVMRNEAYFPYAAMTNDERNAADGRFRAACY
jgi:hypothetical protein